LSDEQLKYVTLIETSKDNYQGWIKLDKVYLVDTVQLMKKYLIQKLGADKAASSPWQPMRLPGFYSYKREEPFFVKVVHKAVKKLPGRKLLEKVKMPVSYIIKVAYSDEGLNEKEYIEKQTNRRWQDYSYYKARLGYKVKRFNPLDERDVIVKNAEEEDLSIDENIIDIYYIYQLLIRGYTKEQIFDYLQRTRKDLYQKHDAADYFERTYLKALLFKKLYYPRMKLYQNSELLAYIEQQKKNGNWDHSKKVTENLKALLENLEEKEQQEN
jgi:hypothetical protein